MKVISIALVSLVLISCSDSMIEEVVFRKTLESSLIELCGETDKMCIEAVKNQISGCMEQSNWRQYLNDQENPEEFQRFTSKFYSCIVDKDGNPIFQPN